MTNQTNYFEEMMNAINRRVSVRKYTPLVLSKEVVQTLLDAATRAPTAMHQEPWSFIVIQDRRLLKKISDCAKPLFIQKLHLHDTSIASRTSHFTEPDFNIFYDASTLIVICADESLPFAQADCWLAAENIMLVASAMCLGSCVIGSALEALNTESIRSELAIPADVKAIAAIIVGTPESCPVPTQRRDPRLLGWKSA